MTTSADTQFDTAVNHPLPFYPLPDLRRFKQVDQALLGDARPDRRLELFAAATLEYDGLDTLRVRKV